MKMLFARIDLRRSGSIFLVIGIFATLSQALLILNPGFYSHDELQWRDVFYQTGFWEFLRRILDVRPGDSFGYPVRPLTFLVLGLKTQVSYIYPQLMHLFSVLVTAITAFLIYKVLVTMSSNAKAALLAACVFIVLPSSTLATGWAGALMDQWFTLFGLLGFYFSLKFAKTRNYFWLILVVLSFILALASKETAVVLPAIFGLLFFGFRDHFALSKRHVVLLFIGWLFPFILYVNFRLPALLGSFGSSDFGGYNVTPWNIPANIYAYFIYPFMLPVFELHTYVTFPIWLAVLSFLLHAVLLVLLAKYRGIKYVILYLFVYFGFLAPILFLEGKGSHYLYSSGIPMAVALSLILTGSPNVKHRITIIALLTGLALHGFFSQIQIYADGACSSSILRTVELAYQRLDKPRILTIASIDGQPNHVLLRMFFERNQIGYEYPIQIKVESGLPTPNRASISVDDKCVAHVMPFR